MSHHATLPSHILFNNDKPHIRSLFYSISVCIDSEFHRTKRRSLTPSLTDSCLVDLTDVTLAFKDANSKFFDGVTVADEEQFGKDFDAEDCSRYRG